MERAADPVPVSRRVGSRLVLHVPATARDKQRTVGPIWPTARGSLGEGGPAARRLPRGGHRSAANGDANGRNRSAVGERGALHEDSPSWVRERRTGAGRGVYER